MASAYVEAGRFGKARRRLRIGPAIFGEIEPDAFQALRRIEIAGPFPGRNREVDFVVLRRNAELLGAAPRDRPDISVFLIVFFQNKLLRGIDLGDRVGDFKVEDLRRPLQALGVLGAFEDDAAIGAFALEHAACVVQAMGQYADL